MKKNTVKTWDYYIIIPKTVRRSIGRRTNGVQARF